MTKRKLLDTNGRAVVPLKSRQMLEYQPVTFTGEITTRICNASMRESYTGNRMAPARGEAAMRAAGIRSVGTPC